MSRLPFIVALVVSLGACGDRAGGEYKAPDPGLLGNPAFAAAAGGEGVAPPWVALQHAGEPSYSISAENGVLRIERTGDEPWGQLSQSVSASQIKGGKAVFSVELAGELEPIEDPSGIWSGKTGLNVVVNGYPGSSVTRHRGKRILVNKSLEPGLEPGSHEWQRYRLVFDVPENATDLQVSIQLTLGGVLKARGPRLAAVD